MTSDTERSAHPGHPAAGQHRATPPPRPTAIRGAALVGVLLVTADLTTKLFVAHLLTAGQRRGPLIPVTNPEFAIGLAGT